jgi:hypothetical protein
MNSYQLALIEFGGFPANRCIGPSRFGISVVEAPSHFTNLPPEPANPSNVSPMCAMSAQLSVMIVVWNAAILVLRLFVIPYKMHTNGI